MIVTFNSERLTAMFYLPVLLLADAAADTSSALPTNGAPLTTTSTQSPTKEDIYQNKHRVATVLNDYSNQCTEIKNGTHPTVHGMDDGLVEAAHNNCLFALAWARTYHSDWLHYGETLVPEANPVAPLLSETDFAMMVWWGRFGTIWEACRPTKQYDYALSLMGADFSITQSQGKALCETDDLGHVKACQCSEDFMTSMKGLSSKDRDTILNGTCKTDADYADYEGRCIPGAKWLSRQYAKEHNCHQLKCVSDMNWYAILRTLSQIETAFVTAVHMSRSDAQWIMSNFEYMFDHPSCPSPTEFAGRSPFPPLKCMDKKKVAELRKAQHIQPTPKAQ